MMEFTDDNVDEEKEELSNEVVASLKQKIIALEEQATELHPVVLRPTGQLRCASQSHHEQVEVLRQGFRQPVTLQCSMSIG
jgi:hypothetical protein